MLYRSLRLCYTVSLRLGYIVSLSLGYTLKERIQCDDETLYFLSIWKRVWTVKSWGNNLWRPDAVDEGDSFDLVQHQKYQYQALILGRTTIDDNFTYYENHR